MGKVKAIGKQGITPAVIIQTLSEELPELRDLYVVGIDQSGTVRLYASGDLKALALASAALQNLTQKYIEGAIET